MANLDARKMKVATTMRTTTKRTRRRGMAELHRRVSAFGSAEEHCLRKDE